MFDTVLVANRGEIAVRIMRTLRQLGIRSVAVYSEADADANHVRVADVAHLIGPASPAESYLSVGRIIAAARASGAQALHPGYGFLSENTALAQACAEAGIVFVGPPSSAIDAMGDKIRAKETVSARGVRVVPGVSGVGLSNDELATKAVEVGFPLLIKPSAGGGGKGMRLVSEVAELDAALASAKREALGAFGDDTLLVERFIERPRHIEVQVLADAHGNVVHLGERECSLQRRHQKVIEEAPSPLLAQHDREAIGAQAVAAAVACGYVNAGTVEFIVSGDRPDEPFFMEMNTRLQVEHPVTEAVWGIDLVEMQLRVANGERLPFGQDELRATGHAFEARVYAEDSAHGFLPTGGRVIALHEPADRSNVRVDSSLAVGTEVSSNYDPMLSKVIAWGPDRDTARRSLDAALADTSVLGVTTNVAFLRRVLADPRVVEGDMDTELVERIAAATTPPAVPLGASVAAAISSLGIARTGAALAPWDDSTGWRLGEAAWTHWNASVDGNPVALALRVTAAGLEVDDGSSTRRGSWRMSGDGVDVELDGTRTAMRVERSGDHVWVSALGDTWAFTLPQPVRPDGARAREHATEITSPMPGTVVAVLVHIGEAVERGQALLVVEAMKMEHTLRAAADGNVAEVLVAAGDRVGLNERLAVIEAAASTEEN